MNTPDQEITSTFVFADIAGYTALTEAHGDEEAAELARQFCRAVSARVTPEAGEVVKTIGDAVMLRIADAAGAVRLGLEITHELLADHGAPAVRVGMHHGAAIEREGDWFGGTVNIAARVAALATGGEVLLTGAVRDAAGDLEHVRFEQRGEQRLRNVATAIPLFAALANGRSQKERHLDPVCRMLVSPGREAGTLKHEGTDYCFCSLECAERFAADPGCYVGE